MKGKRYAVSWDRTKMFPQMLGKKTPLKGENCFWTGFYVAGLVWFMDFAGVF